MAQYCFGIYLWKDKTEKYITNLSMFNYFIRNSVQDFMIASAKEIISRSENHSIVDIELNFNKKFYLVGVKNIDTSCFIFTTEENRHTHLITLAKYIIHKELADSIQKNFEYITTELKYVQISKELDDIKYIMIENIDILLKRGENLDDLVERTNHLSDESKIFYIRTKKMNNSCCNIF